ncbi:hypothetical protein [Haloactinopolyspora alba]|nr:hypothetical protein [Haloactinopolyspora alba]
MRRVPDALGEIVAEFAHVLGQLVRLGGARDLGTEEQILIGVADR